MRLKVQPDLVGLLNNQRLYYKQANDAAGCRKTAELWEKLRRTDPRSLYNAACYRAVTAQVVHASDKSPAGARAALAEADRAMAWLKQAIAAGYDNVALMKQDSDLEALRDRAEFRKLLAELEAASAKVTIEVEPPIPQNSAHSPEDDANEKVRNSIGRESLLASRLRNREEMS